MHFPLGSSKTILERPRKTIRNFANICSIASSQPGKSKHLTVERNAQTQKQVPKFQSLIIPNGNTRSPGLTLVIWLTWVSLCSASTRPFPLTRNKIHNGVPCYASLPLGNEVFHLLLTRGNALNLWKVCLKNLQKYIKGQFWPSEEIHALEILTCVKEVCVCMWPPIQDGDVLKNNNWKGTYFMC